MSRISVRERRVRANGLDHHAVCFEAASRELPVLLIHGFLDQARSFRWVAEALVEMGRTAIAVSLRGHGETEWVGCGGYYHFPDYVLDLRELCPQLAPSGFHVLGHSMGGTASALYASTRPTELRSLVLVEGLGPPDASSSGADRLDQFVRSVERERKTSRAPIRNLDEAVDRLTIQHGGMPRAILEQVAFDATIAVEGGLEWRFDPLHRTTAPHPFIAEHFRARLAKIQVPVLGIGGTRGFRLDDQKARAAAVPDMREAMLEGGHMLHWEKPRELAQLTLEHATRAEAQLSRNG